MRRHAKIVRRFLSKPSDFTWDELTVLLSGFGYTLIKAGRPGGSRVRFDCSTRYPIILHRPHPTSILKKYQLEQIEEILRKEGLI